MAKRPGRTNSYKALIERIFFEHWEDGVAEFEFARDEAQQAASALGIKLPKNVGDIFYSFRFRIGFPQSIIDTQSNGLEWVIQGAGKSRYRFKLVPITRIKPREDLARIAIPDATPELNSCLCTRRRASSPSNRSVQ